VLECIGHTVGGLLDDVLESHCRMTVGGRVGMCRTVFGGCVGMCRTHCRRTVGRRVGMCRTHCRRTCCNV